jgi:hypothetical protein
MADRVNFGQISKVVKDRAAELARRGESAFENVPKEVKEKVLDAMDEVEKLWKAGKPVQRRAQTVLAPVMWQAQTGIAPEKLDLGTATDLEDLMQPGFTPQWSQFINIAAHSLLGSYQMYGRITETAFMVAIQLPFTSLFIYMQARRFGTPSVFELRDSLAEKLVLTEADEISPRDVRPPLPGFYIQMPPGALELRNVHTGWHKVTFIGVASAFVHAGPRAGRTLMSLFWCEPNERSTSATDDNAQVSFISLPENYDGSIEQYETTIRTDTAEGVPERSFVRWQGKELPYEEGHKLLRKFVISFCLYLSSPNPDIQPTGGKQTWKDVVEKAEGAHAAGPHVRRQVTIGKNFSLWDVGRNVRRLQKLTATDILVKGHWRRQAHGVARLLRRVIWIEPFVRRPTGGEVEGHEYDVRADRDVKENPDDLQGLAQRIAERLKPVLGAALAAEVANGAAQAYAAEEGENESVVVVVRDVLTQRKRHPTTYRAEHLTDEMIDEALTAVEDMEWS